MSSRARPPRRATSTPSTRMRPPSGRTSPMRWRRNTDLPPPLRPMMIVMEPVGTSRSRPRSTSLRPNDLRSPSTLITPVPPSRQHRAEKVVPDEDQDGRHHDRLGGGARDALGAVPHVKALVRADPRHNDAEGNGFPEAEQHVADVDE